MPCHGDPLPHHLHWPSSQQAAQTLDLVLDVAGRLDGDGVDGSVDGLLEVEPVRLQLSQQAGKRGVEGEGRGGERGGEGRRGEGREQSRGELGGNDERQDRRSDLHLGLVCQQRSLQLSLHSSSSQ